MDIEKIFAGIVLKTTLAMALLITNVQAQSIIDSVAGNLIENLMERQAANPDRQPGGSEDLSRIAGHLNRYLQRPLDLNMASAEELDDLYILNDLQISTLLNQIRTNGPLADLLELPAEPGFDVPLVRLLLPFELGRVSCRERVCQYV